jgi:hypothetical protein
VKWSLDGVRPDQVKAIFAIGYPTNVRTTEVTFDEDFNPTGMYMINRWVRLYLELDGPALLDVENRRPLVKHRTFEQTLDDPDGLSGAAVFFVHLNTDLEARLGYAGMITHARHDRFMVYDGTIIRRIVDEYIDTENSTIC